MSRFEKALDYEYHYTYIRDDYDRDVEAVAYNTFCYGNIEEGQYNKKGGGLRVKSIRIGNPLSQSEQINKYSYKFPEKDISSGVTSYDPMGTDSYQKVDYIPNLGSYQSELIEAGNNHKGVLNQYFPRLLRIAREVPSPGVIYKYVTVTSSVEKEGQERDLKGKTIYNFQTFEEDMIEVTNNIHYESGIVGSGDSKRDLKASTHRIKDKSSIMGNLLSVVNYDGAGNLLNKMENVYTTDPNEYRNQGLIEEVHHEHRYHKASKTEHGVVSIRSKYPVILKKNINTDYISGLTTETENLGFDFYTGEVTHTKSIDGYGNEFIGIATPAYQLENGDSKIYPEMGLKVNNPTNKNMLTQKGSGYTYKLKTNGTLEFDAGILGVQSGELMGASVQTWTNQINIREEAVTVNNATITYPRKAVSYVWTNPNANADGTSDGFVPFDWNTPSLQHKNWLSGIEATLYSPRHHVLESKDINGIYASAQFNDDEKVMTANISNARYTEFAYSGAEYQPISFGNTNVYDESGVFFNQAQRVSKADGNPVHTGEYSLAVVGNGENGFEYECNVDASKPSKWYQASVWVRAGDGAILNDARLVLSTSSGSIEMKADDSKARQSGDWTQLHLRIATENVPTIEAIVRNEGNGTLYFDDFRIHPMDAPMTSYVYDQQNGALTYILDNYNLFTHFIYDDMGRLQETYQESFKYGVKKISSQKYNYGRDQD